MRNFFVGLVLLCAVMPAVAQQSPYVLVRVKMPSGLAAATVPVVVALDLKDIRSALKLSQPLQSGMVKAVEGTAPVPAQLDVANEAQGQACLMLPTQPAGQRLVKLYLTQAASAPADGQRVKLTQQDAVITVKNNAVALTFDPSKNGGLPSKIVFQGSGKTFEGFSLNDRVYSKELQGFRLGDDKSPTVMITADGPLCTQVQVKARYLKGEQATPTNARATYTFTFFAGSPTFRIAGDMAQDSAFGWDELHFLELFFRDQSFPEFAMGEPLQRQAFKDESKSYEGSSWGALLEGQNGIAFLASARLYDGKKDYGQYLHGPWVSWGDVSGHFAVDVWAGTAPDPVAAIRAAATSGPRALTGMALTPGLVVGLEKLKQAGARSAWLAALLEKAVAEGHVGLLEGEKLAATLGSAAPATKLHLGNLDLELLSDRGLGLAVSYNNASAQLVSIFDLGHQREILAAPCRMFDVALTDAEKHAAGLSSDAGFKTLTRRLSSDGKSLHLEWGNPENKALEGLAAQLDVRLDGAQSHWSVNVSNPSKQWSIEKVTLPSLKIAALGDDVGDDTVLIPEGFGRALPVTSGRGYAGPYPSGGCVMQWMGVCDDTSGVYVAQHDPTASTKTLYANCGGEGAYSTLRIDVPAENATVPGNSYKMQGEVIVGVTDGGWWPMTRIYRNWLVKNAPWWPEPKSYSRSDYPKWLEQVQTWVQYGAGWAKDTVPKTIAFAQAMGVPTAIHWYNWHQIPFDNQYPHYFPAKEGFREGVAALQKAGVHVMPYINGRLWDKDTDDFRAGAYKYATKMQNGEPYIERYGSGRDLVPMCVSQPFWQEKIQSIVTKLVGEEGVDGVYIDQIGAAASVLCYDKSHGHPLAGGHWWVDGYWKMLGPLQEKIGPDKMLTTESNAEPYAKYIDAYLMCNDNSDYNVPLFPAVYGGKILMFGTYVGQGDWHDMTLMALRQGKLFAFGSQLWWADPNLVSSPEGTKWLHDTAHLRQQVNEFFVHGQMAAPPKFAEKIGMLDTPWKSWGPSEITLHTPDLWATTWRLEKGQLLMPLVNLPKEERTFTLQFDPAAYGLKPNVKVKVERLNAEGVVETVHKQGRFDLPVKLGPAEATALRITAD